MKVNIVKSKRRKKTVSLKVKDKIVTVYAPSNTSDKFIHNFLSEHKDWVNKQLSTQVTKLPIQQKTSILYFGNRVNLKFIKGTKKSYFNSLNNTIYIYLKGNNYKNALLKFLKAELKNYIINYITNYINKIEGNYKKITIKNVTSLWGSCSKANNLNFNFRLIFTPKPIINYVIAHEVAHIVHKNHSKKFWNLVENLYPNYKEAKKFINKNSQKISNEF